MPGASGEKICVLCGEDCSGKPRIKDTRGRYYCRECHERATARLKQRHANASEPNLAATPAPPVTDSAEPDLGYALVEDAPPAGTEPAPSSIPDPSNLCPSCDRPLPLGTKICVDCGINIETGRSIIMSRGLDENIIHHNTERILRPISWLIPFAFNPVASEAIGNRKPYTTWAIVTLTCLVSFWFWFSTDAQMRDRKNLLLWSGHAQPSAEYLEELYEWTNWGDARAFQNALNDIQSRTGSSGAGAMSRDDLFLAAHNSMSARQQAIGTFRVSQLFSHALLHAGLFHLLGNMVFLLIFGSRVNALIGNVATAIAYPILAVLAAWAQMMSSSDEMPMAMLGASGAIMGLAGMYFVLFPANRMYMSIWFRFLFFFRMKIWPLRGFWVVLIYIAFDIFYISRGSDTGTAHWAHLGGFIAGMVIALGLLLSRLLFAGGTDLISLILGRHAWAVLGRPGDRDSIGFSWPNS